ncbi:MAG: glycosyltransferase family 4 protein [Treponema sp.]|nr:glycosyltransferase family 4 protein [Treponema sp.]
MKLCIFTNHFFPEDFKVNDIAFDLQKKDFDITVITAIPDYPKGKFYDGYSLFKKRKEVVNGVNVIRLPIIPRGKGGAIRLALNYISYFVCATIFTFFHSFKNQYDAVFVHLTSPFFIGIPAVHLKKRQKIPLYFWTLDLWPESLISAAGIKHPLIIEPQNKMVAMVYSNCDKILISSKGFAKSICEKGNFEDKLVYFPNWAESVVSPSDFDISKISPFDDKSNFILLFAGNLGEAQNLDTIIESADRLKDNEKIKFVFVGDGRRKIHLENLVAEKKLNNTVYFLGRYPIDTMPVFMGNASVLLFSLKDELCFNLTVPAKVQFYMSQGKPILAMINGDGADLVNESKCGIAVPANDVNSFVEAVKKLASLSEENIDQFGINGKTYYEMNFTKEQRMDQLIRILLGEE